MIKLERGNKPSYLTDAKVEALTQEYKENGKSVWNKDQIKTPLSESTSHKCAYCETDLNSPSIYMEVEHFLPKSKYEDLVVIWNNLLPSCKRCNGTKNDDDILANPIINPFDKDPREDFYFDHFYIFGKTELGENTESTLNLNDEVLFLKRCKVAGIVKNDLIQMSREFSKLSQLDGHKRRKLRAVLLAAQPDRPYSAFVATIIHNTREYSLLKQRFIEEAKWTEELTKLHNTSFNLILPLRK
ncbi:HNH endonuclease [Acinetobacter sp. NIPH 298]|uniref:HNH endonuclease n=1 Tax=Acinetobacter sp. NIPH 298 TaxID=1217692 RepID=UPI0002D09DEF|nr:HNH endonuclease [Acinetobacter sp. NIPH 298]ENW97846.1 TIGR02646 family protein [Acinetobacter sp. NIPH 298]